MMYFYRFYVILLILVTQQVQLLSTPFFFISQENEHHLFEPELATLTPVFSTEHYYSLKLSSNIIENQLIPLMRAIYYSSVERKLPREIIERLHSIMAANACHENLQQLAKIILAANELGISLLKKAGISYLMNQYISYTPNQLIDSIVGIYRNHEGLVSPINMFLSKKNNSCCNYIYRRWGPWLHHNATQYHRLYHQWISYADDPIISCACSPGGWEMATLTQQGFVCIMNIKNGWCNYYAQLTLPLGEHLGQSYIDFAPDNHCFFVLTPTQLWIKPKEYVIQPFDVQYLTKSGKFQVAAFSPCSNFIVAAVNNNVYLIELATFNHVLLYTIPDAEYKCTSIVFTPDGLEIISGATNGMVEIRDSQSGELKTTYDVKEPVVAMSVTKHQGIAVLTTSARLHLFDDNLDLISAMNLNVDDPIDRPRFSNDGLRIMGLMKSYDEYYQVGIFDTQSRALCQIHAINRYGQIYPCYTFHADNWGAFITKNNAIELFEMPCFKNQGSELKLYQLLFILLCKSIMQHPQTEYFWHHPKIMKSILASFDERTQQFLWRQYHGALSFLCDDESQ